MFWKNTNYLYYLGMLRNDFILTFIVNDESGYYRYTQRWELASLRPFCVQLSHGIDYRKL